MRAYYDDSYTHDFEAEIVERLIHQGKPAVILDHSFFYPTGGGQPQDSGVIAGVAVVDVVTRKADQAVIHVLAGSIEADRVVCHIDWARRFDHMQQHTGQHILSQAFLQTCGTATVGFHLSADSLTIDLDRPMIDDAQAIAAEELANAILFADHPVTAQIANPSATESIRMRKLPDQLTTDGLRVITIGDPDHPFDATACGGTHVRRTGEIGMIALLKLEKRGEKTRVEFRCGGRALAEFRLRNSVANALAARLTVAIPELPQAVERLQDEAKTAARDLRSARSALLDLEVVALSTSASECLGARAIVRCFVDRPNEEVKLLAGKCANVSGTIALLAALNGDRVQFIFARADDTPGDMAALLTTALGSIDQGRGGGKAALAQGGGAADLSRVEAALATAYQAVCASD